MKRRASSLLLVAVSIGLAACTAGAPAATPSPAAPSNPPTNSPSASPSATIPPNTITPTGLTGRHFIATGVTDGGDDFPLVPGTRIDLSFVDGIQAQAGCNHLFATYTLDGDRIIVDGIGSTEMGCEPQLMAQDQWLSVFLGSAPTYVLDGNNLTLTVGDVVITLSDREVVEPDQPLTNITWTLSSLITGDAVSSVPVGIVATLLFLDDGTVQVNFGCNTGGGNYTVEGDQIDFSNLIQTEMACAGAAGAVESAVATVLTSESVTFTIDGSTLTLTAGPDGLQYSAATDLPIRDQ